MLIVKLGAEIHEDLRAESTKEVYFPDLLAIVLRPGLPGHERKYLIAHALGHHLFHRTGPNSQSASFHNETSCGSLQMGRMEVSRTEMEADLFAGYLLISPTKLRPILGHDWIKEADDPVLRLALEFQVPVELMHQRLIYEGLMK